MTAITAAAPITGTVHDFLCTTGTVPLAGIAEAEELGPAAAIDPDETGRGVC